MALFASNFPKPSRTHAVRATAGTLTALAAAFAALGAEASVRTAENSGTVCVLRNGAGVLVTLTPDLGCLSSSCTRVLENTLEVVVDDGVIAMTSRFRVLERAGPSQLCSRDCDGAGRAAHLVPALADGTYVLRLGGVDIGTLDTAELGSDPLGGACFTSP